MKKTVISTTLPENLVGSNQTNSSKFYGAQIGSSRAFVSAGAYGGKFALLAIPGMTRGNRYDGFGEHETLKNLCDRVNKSGHKVYEFDTARELFLWLAEAKEAAAE